METSTPSTMVGEFPIRPSGQNQSQAKFNSSKEKGRRLESITAKLQPYVS